MDYWESRKGKKHKRHSRAHRAIVAAIDQEPVRKGKRGAASGAAFRNAMHAAISDHPNWPRRKARLAVDLKFFTSKKQPPNLEHLAKYYLDQLGQTHDRGEGGHIYRDDRQVQLLHVSAHHGWDIDGPRLEPGVFVMGRTAAEACADAREASQLLDPNERYSMRDVDMEDIWEQLRDAEKISESRHPSLRRAAPLMRFTALRRAQEGILHSNDRWIENLFGSSAPYLLFGKDALSASLRASVGARDLKIIDDSHLMGRTILLGGDPDSIALPPLPTTAGGGKQFRMGVRNAIAAYVDSRKLLFPLLVPTRLTLFVVQPQQPRDLDNILLDLLPVVDDIMVAAGALAAFSHAEFERGGRRRFHFTMGTAWIAAIALGRKTWRVVVSSSRTHAKP